MHYASFPKVLVVLCDQPQPILRRRIHTLMDLYSPDPGRPETQALGVCLTTMDDLRRAGPFAPIFWSPSSPRAPLDILGRPGERGSRPRR
jgi:hypothetical protein